MVIDFVKRNTLLDISRKIPIKTNVTACFSFLIIPLRTKNFIIVGTFGAPNILLDLILSLDELKIILFFTMFIL